MLPVLQCSHNCSADCERPDCQEEEGQNAGNDFVKKGKYTGLNVKMLVVSHQQQEQDCES